jgi:hypothetical protein
VSCCGPPGNLPSLSLFSLFCFYLLIWILWFEFKLNSVLFCRL